MKDRRPEVAEAIGVFFLVLVGCATAVLNARTGSPGAVGVALGFGLTIVVLVYALGHVCGAHFNPAITLALALTGHFPWRRVASYFLAQSVGGIVAATTLRAVVGDISAAVTLPVVSPASAFAVEVLATFLLGLVIIGVATDRRAAPAAAGLAIGLTVAVNALAFGPLTGASMNPARSLGPALLASEYASLWLYVTAPIVGAALAMFAYEWLRRGTLRAESRDALGALGPIGSLEEARS